MKKIVVILLGLVLVFTTVCVFAVGGKAGAYAWNAAVFVLAPLAIMVTLIQIIIVCIRLFKRKMIIWNIAFVLISVLYALPILVLLGVSPITYPTLAKEEDCIKLMTPVPNAVYLGGKTYKTHAYWPSECYAYDVLKKPYDIGSNNLQDYGIFGDNISCPVIGTVISIENKEPDIVPNSEKFKSSYGNYIFIKVDTTETYIILAHLMKDSIAVSVGEHVTKGDYLGKVGNSGTTSEPHLHIQHQRDNPLDLKMPIFAEGLPIEFISE